MTLFAQAVRPLSASLRLGLVLPLGLAIRAYGGTDKRVHGYDRWYVRHLGHLRWKRNLILEIGVGGYEQRSVGGSLRVWRDYFARSTIVGFDIHAKEFDLGSRVHFVLGDQANEVDLARALATMGATPNIVIDDGSHLAEHAEASFRYLFPRLPAGSFYVIEDLHTSYLESFGGGVPAGDSTAVGFVKHLVDAVQARDLVFERKPHWKPPMSPFPGVGEIHVYPGVVFIEKV